jgi:hypothetical protein
LEGEGEPKVEGEEFNYEGLKRALVVFFSLLLFSMGFAIGFSSGPAGTGITVLVSIMVYVILFTLGPAIRVPFLALAAGTHVGFLSSHWETTTVLPLVVISKDKLGGSLAIDFVQIFIYLEIAYDILKYRRDRAVKEDEEKKDNYVSEEEQT